MKAFIHLHPHFAHFIQSIQIADKVQHISTVECSDCPSLQGASVRSFSKYLNTNTQLIEAAINKKLVHSHLRIKLSAYIRSFYCETPRSLIYAVSDSLIRSRLSYLYCSLPRLLQAFVNHIFLFRAKALLFTYQERLRDSNPSIVITSHATYVPYVALIEASVYLQIPILVLYNCDGLSALHYESRPVYHLSSFAQQIMSSKIMSDKILKPAKSTYAHASSIYNTISSARLTPSSISHSGEEPTSHSSYLEHNEYETYLSQPYYALIVAPHCIKDNNHVTDPGSMLFLNYFQWILGTVCHLMLHKTSYNYIIFKIHPHAPMFQDNLFLKVLAKLLKSGINSRKVLVVNPNETDFLSRLHPSTKIVPVTVNGSIACESASVGIKTLSAGAPPAPKNSYYRPNSVKLYYRALESPHNLPASFFEPLDAETILQAKKFISLYESLKPHRRLKPTIHSLRKYFYFGDHTHISVDDLRSKYSTLSTLQRFSIHKLDPSLSMLIHD